MKKIILTAVMVFILSYAGLIDFSFAEDFVKDLSKLTGAERAGENGHFADAWHVCLVVDHGGLCHDHR